MEHPVHEAPDGIVPHAVPHDVEARQIGPQHEAGVGAVENTYLALFIGGHVGDYRAVEARPLKGQLLLQPCRTFDVPHAEDFPHVDEIIPIAVGGFHGGGLYRVLHPTGDDAVHQGGAEGALPHNPGAEFGFQGPLVDIPVHASE